MIWNALSIAVREIGRNLTRAFLTVLGIFIGVAAIITMVTLGQGATLAVKAQISSLGNNLLTLRPGAGFGSRAPSAGVPHFTEKDATIIGEQIAGIAAVAPVRTASLSTIYLQNARASTVTGTTPVYFQINKWNIAEGRFFNDADLRSGAAVCVIGNTVRTLGIRRPGSGNASPRSSRHFPSSHHFVSSAALWLPRDSGNLPDSLAGHADSRRAADAL
jgi:putative ABC transport system permease protein